MSFCGGAVHCRRPDSPEQHPEGVGSHRPQPCRPRSAAARRCVPALCDVQGLLEIPRVLPVYRYEGLEELLAALAERVIAPAEAKVKALKERRRIIEAELIKPR